MTVTIQKTEPEQDAKNITIARFANQNDMIMAKVLNRPVHKMYTKYDKVRPALLKDAFLVSKHSLSRAWNCNAVIR